MRSRIRRLRVVATASATLYSASSYAGVTTTVAAALSLNPSNRYREVMGKLLRDHQQLNVVASPVAEVEVSEEVASNAAAEDVVGEPTHYQRQRELFEGYYPAPPTEEPVEGRGAGGIYEALNGHIESIDQQFQTSDSLRSVGGGGDETSSPRHDEAEWEYDHQGGQFFRDEASSPEMEMVDAVEANGATYYFESTGEMFGNEEDQIAEAHPSEQENQELRLELERLTAEKAAAEETARRAEEELRKKLERQYIEAARAETVDRLKKEKEALKLELARRVAADERRALEARLRCSPTSSIAKSHEVPKLPDTNDPFELLGLDHRNPPENAEDLRRAFLKMAKKYHPDAVAKDASEEVRARASLYFARVNGAYQLLKDKRERLGDEYFATVLGGPMHYEPDSYGSIFSGNSYSATYGTKRGRGNKHSWNARNPFRRNRREAGDNCHVSMQDEDFPPFFNH